MLSNQISLKSSAIIRTLGIVVILLILASGIAQLASRFTGHEYIYGLVPLLNLDAEQNIPTFFSTFLLLFADLLLWIITVLKRNQMDPRVSYWTLLSFGFLCMAVDEASSLHELLVRPMRMLLGDGSLGIFYFAWVIPGIVLVLVLALFFSRFLWSLPPKTRFTFLLAATLYLGGAIGFELIGGRIDELSGRNLSYSIISTIEESLEMTGMIIFICALLQYISNNYTEVRFSFIPVHGEAMHNSSQVSRSASASTPRGASRDSRRKHSKNSMVM